MLNRLPSRKGRKLKSGKLVTWIIVLVTIAIVVTPLLRAGLRSEVAQWYLAAAANAIELKLGDGRAQLSRAEQVYPSITESADYWDIRIHQSESDPEKLAELPRLAPASLRRVISVNVITRLLAKQEFSAALTVADWVQGEDPEILKNGFFWHLLVQLDYQAHNSTRAVERLKEAVKFSSDFRPMATLFSRIFLREHEFDAALESLKLGLGESFERNSDNLNQLAYLRSLAIVELEDALKDINEALQALPPGIGQNLQQAMLRDTRGWILYRLGKYDDALVDLEFAVRETERPTITTGLMNWLQDAAVEAAQQADSEGPLATIPRRESSGEYASESEVEPSVWALGVMKYHRAKVLEKLGRSDEAQLDWDWLAERRLPPDDRLH